MFLLRIFKGRAFRIVVTAVVLLVFFVVLSTPGASAQSCSGGCEPMYTCKKGSCVCRWGKLEVGLLGVEKGTDICELISPRPVGQGSGTGAVVWLVQQAVTAVMALTVMAAMVSIVIGGYIYMTAGGNADRVRTAKAWIGSALLGVILAMLAWMILALIATNLVDFS